MMIPSENRRIAAIKAAVLILFVITAIGVAHFTPVRNYLTADQIAVLLDAVGLWAPLAYVLFVVVGVCLFVPGTLLVAVGAAIFGGGLGFLYGWIGTMLGAALAFLMSRYLGRDFTSSLVGDKLKKYDDQIARNGFATVLYLRLACMPFSPLSFGMGLTKVRFRDFLLGTGLGIIVALFVIAFFVGAVKEVWDDGRWEELLSWKMLLVVALLVFSFFIPKLVGRFGAPQRIQEP